MTTKPDSSARSQVLLAEGDADQRGAMRLHLAAAGFEVTDVGHGQRVLDIAKGMRFDLVIVDARLPGIDGVTICRSLRAESANAQTPILIVAAPNDESDTLLGLEVGADDYVHRPIVMRELTARAHALVRRATRAAPKGGARLIRTHELALDPDRRTVTVRGQPVELTRQEFDLAYLLAARPGIVFSRAALMARVWTGDTYVTERTVDTVVSRLRKKLERDAQDPQLILTAWGVGYKFAERD